MENIIQTPIVEEVEQSFLDYSLSVITDRAIPSVEDGFKPVQRRILYGMLEGGYKSDKPKVKCARPVGDVMGNFHPHGDSSIYGALVVMSQPWTMRYPLIDFQGNNGSRDGDGPAAYRYTECRLNKLAEATLANIKKNSVDWVPNFDETKDEPVYLPGMFPNLLCNGTTGIAVAMACSFAPHNLKEIMEAAKAYLEGKSKEEIIDFIKGPDFPTGGIIINQNELKDIYLTGKGRIRLRGEYINEKNTLIFTSIPYKVSKEDLQKEIDTLCEEGKLVGITAIRDESTSKGVRFVIEYNPREINGDMLARQLYKLTNLETVFNVNQVALENKTPRLMTTYELIEGYCKHQLDVYKRSLEYDKQKLAERIEILIGLLKAMEDIDNVIALIKSSASAAEAKTTLQKKYDLSIRQAEAILDMKLSRLAHMEKIELENELQEKNNSLEGIKFILSFEANLRSSLKQKFIDFANTFGDKRITQLTNFTETKEEAEVVSIIPEDVVIQVTEDGMISRTPSKKFKPQRRNGKGVKTKGDIIHTVIATNTQDILMIFTSFGKVYRIGANEVPEDKAVSVASLIQMENSEKFMTLASTLRGIDGEKTSVWFFTRNGVVKRTLLKEYEGAKRKNGLAALNLREGDQLVAVKILSDSITDIFITTHNGMMIRCAASDFALSSRSSIGVKGINVDTSQDYVVSANGVTDNGKLMISIFTENGYGKHLKPSDFLRQNRGGKGLKCIPSSEIASAVITEGTGRFLVMGTQSNICVNYDEFDTATRQAIGKKVIKEGKINQVIGVN